MIIQSSVLTKIYFKKSLTEFVKLRDEFGIVRAETTLDSCADLFAQGKLAYTITDVSHLNTIAESGISYGVCNIPALSDDMQIENISENLCAFVNPYLIPMSRLQRQLPTL